MKNQWIIQCVGTSEEDQAHLRLLLRSARKHVGEDWVWGSDAALGSANVAGDRISGATSEADLLLFGSHSPISETATRRASERGVTSAQLIESDAPAPTGLFLRKPFHSDAFAALLNEVARSAANTGRAESANPAVPHPPSSNATDPGSDENLMRSLLHYLPKRVLGGTALIALPGSPPLVIDPDARMFWAKGTLPTIEPYVREPLRFGDWKRLGGTELEEACKGVVARPYAYLIWMDTFIHSKGILSRRFDPLGTYSLTKRLDLANDYPRALRISAQMNRPRTLDAIAYACGIELAEVFDVVNAYDAIGYLEWTRPGAAPPRRT